ncbi:MAG TPA: ABC transporter ATP-binding protein [Acidobacteriota bacterium]|nr:ABC transporter ATP-binding protein [Acidobacteriota bacterium]
MNDFRRLFRFVKPYLAALIFSLVLLVFAGFFEVLTTALAIPLFDDILNPGSAPNAKFAFLKHYLSLIPGSGITQLAVALVTLTFFKGVCLYHSNYRMSYVGQRVVMDLRDQLYSHVLKQSMGFFSLNSTGRLMARMGSDVEQVQEAVSTTISELFREVVLLAALLVWVFYIDWKLAGISLLIAPAALAMTLIMGKRIRRVSLKSRENVAALHDRLQQSITGMRIVKAFGMEHHEESRFRKSNVDLFWTNMRASRILFLNSPMMELLGVLCFVPLLYYAHARIAERTLSFGAFGGSLFSLFRMYDPMRKLSRIHVQFQRAFASASRIVDLFDTHIEIQDRPNARRLTGIRESIEFKNVTFDYRDTTGESLVLKDINLRIYPKQVVAFVGSSGSGKTTLVGLLPRFYDVTAGAVRIDQVDIREYSQESLRKQIAIVTQDTFLFNDTIRNNILYGDPSASEERIVEAAQAALAHDFIMQFPMKYDTPIGERGQRLSGGERQRISIARAILKNSPILVLDEATSALDSESEKLVQQALSNLMHDRTTFVIAHRLSTIRNADIIVVLEQGQIEEMGTHDSLMELNGLYSRFFRLQTVDSFSTA